MIGPNTALHGRIDRDRLVERTAELIRIPSVNPFDGPADATTGEQAVAHWLAEHLDRLGYQPELTEVAPGRPNVVGVGPGGDGMVLALAGHTDTVGVAGYRRPFDAVVGDGRIRGRGACDMKGALAAFVEVAEVLAGRTEPLTGRLMIAGVADEEHAMTGSKALGAPGPLADQIIVGEPTGLRLCTGHKGQLVLPIRTTGRAVHSSIADQGINAIEHMMEVVAELGRYRTDLTSAPAHPRYGFATVNPGVIDGGAIASIVPDWCRLEVDRRILPGENSSDVAAELRSRIEALGRDRPEFRCQVGRPVIDAAPLHTEEDQPVVRSAMKAMAARSHDPTPAAFTGATDGPNLGAPAVIWGPGSLAQAHTTDEWLAVDELVEATHLYLDVALDLLA